MKLCSYLFFTIIIIVFTSWSGADCKKHFAGKWKYKNISRSEVYVVRTLKKQFEYGEGGKYYYEFNIKWLSDCKYQLTYVGTTSPYPALAEKGESFNVEIQSIDEQYMRYKTVFRDLEEVGEMEKIQ